MNDDTHAAPQASSEVDWIGQFRTHIEAAYPQVFLRVARSTVPRRDTERAHVIVDAIKVDRSARKQGLARAVLTELCAQADRHGDTLSATPNPVRQGEWTADPRRWARFLTTELGFVSNRSRRGRDYSINETHYRRPTPAATEAGQ
ncbi:hypothetical protein [Nocardia sp. NRRL S-836]|uniref:hypothetical protein n=1 Tax=Nocardia sp. NRRL S-836 TaxID=1519492 RepID=UPI000B2AEC15|nr:hypothetical protein [Nocardia sp. NRRL S-836]